jgi:hypothetical protein
MNNSFGQLLTANLQHRGIYKDNYDKIAEAVYASLHAIDSKIEQGEWVIMPNGNEYQKISNIGGTKLK